MKDQTEKPERLPVLIENMPQEIKGLPQWCLWRWEKPKDKWTKPCYSAKGGMAKSNDPKTWASFQDALKAYEGGTWDGIGFMLTPPFVGIDLDSCIDSEGRPRDWAGAVLDQIKSYAETSPSGRGYKILCKGTITKGHHNDKLGLFQNGRYFCLTGRVLKGYEKIENRQQELDSLIKREWPADMEEPKKQPLPKSTLEDKEIIDKVLSAANGEKALDLLNGNISVYPSQSEADQALVNLIAFWTQDRDQIDRIFRTSGLYREEKWGKRQDYRDRTISRALSTLKEKYTPSRSRAVTGELDAVISELEVFDHERLYRELGVTKQSDKSAIRMKLSRMLESEVIRKCKNRPGWFEVVNKDLQPMNLMEKEIETLDLWLPLGISELVKFHPGNIVLVPGDVESGKTGFLLNVAKRNVDRFKVHYFNSEMGSEEFIERLKLFDDWPWGHENFFAYERSNDFHSVMQKGKGNLNIIDFLELTENFYMISSYLNEIHRALNGAIAVVAVQKQNPFTDLPLGGYRGLEKPRLSVVLSKGKIKITKAKNWKNPKVNPKNLTKTFKLVNGCHFIGSTEWRYEEDKQPKGKKEDD